MTFIAETALLELDDAPELKLPPTQDQLPCDDGISMETARHKWQMELLVKPLTTWLANRDAYVGGNMFVYFSEVATSEVVVRARLGQAAHH